MPQPPVVLKKELSKGNLFRLSGEFRAVHSLESLHRFLVQILKDAIDQLPMEFGGATNIRNSDDINMRIDDQFSGPLGVSPQKYLDTLAKHGVLSEEALVLAVIYLARLTERGGIVLTHQNLPKLLATAVMLGCKYLDDVPYNNKSFALCAAIPTAVLNEVEIQFLVLLKFDMHVSGEDFNRTCDNLLRMMNGGDNPAAAAADLWVQSVMEKDWEKVQKNMHGVSPAAAASIADTGTDGSANNSGTNTGGSTESSMKRKFSSIFS